MKTGVNPPKTPVTKGSSGICTATMPNVCKMPGPPAPFVPTPLPNIGQSSDSLDGCTKDVLIEGNEIAIKGATFKSKGDMASKGTGGGLVSSTTHDKTKFVAPGSMDVKAEGENIQLLSDATSNNNSNPANSATIMELQNATDDEIFGVLEKIAEECNDSVNQDEGYTHANPPEGEECTRLGTLKHTCCEDAIKDANNPKVKSEVAYGPRGGKVDQGAAKRARDAANSAYGTAKTAAQAAGKTGKALTQALKGVWIGAFSAAGGAGALRVDAIILKQPDPPAGVGKANVDEAIDFKFNCKGGPKMDAPQKKKYWKALKKVPSLIGAAW